ncbi:Organic hydroperoxide resistance transcriptional regulator [Arthrobacter sp. SO5]|uniref:MarR family winged helix-turn-helix transcriptional regulator n=1 Tax=Arthrobacter sp. SO5 TaxID=1897055 RepID=UPI001E2C9CFF|nr:MarR family transcriptional regulator [Arthrobacter sp. SO5]MCB5276056.1 Organic hydroperoxide resistance transcriptional regulator [Arthrobacter sp. SO5]
MTSDPADYAAFVSLWRQLQLTSGSLRASLAKELGISMAELNALSHAADHDGLTPKKLADLMDLTTGSMTTMIDRLQRAGLLVRQPHPTDRRSLLLALTPGGKQAVKWVNGLYLDAAAAAFKACPRSDLGVQMEFLEALVKSLDASAQLQAHASASAG